MPLAEGPSISGELMAILLFLLLSAAALWVAAVALGFKWASETGRGSRNAAIKWSVAMVVVCAPGRLLWPSPLVLVVVLVLAAHGACYVAARRRL
ncbi:MAG TPA: hypothetical protein VNA20_00285 [Frankiaceae bacterium]|nr:hypothetical protein [Frankiaceae bacterium]